MEMLTTHKMRRGERLETLSARYGVPVCMIMRANDMSDTGGAVGFGQVKIPKRCYCNRCTCRHQTALKYEMVRVQAGDSVYSIAQRCGVTMRIVMRANCLDDPGAVREGDVLSVPVLSGRRCTVRPGERLCDIAKREGVTEARLRDINCLSAAEPVAAGMLLIIG